MLASFYALVFWVTMLAYLLLSLALFYHWYKYSINSSVFTLSAIFYLGATLPLVAVLLTALVNI